ncbi:hypothetical protein V8G54_011664 [Vigna mungo]|uniref:Uncharacterized protein n=1 Tax=Vigna mungo TaxID=3915 RepID=A0AAQ3NRN2_VIGMU
MATLSNRRRTLPPDDIDAQEITADSVSTNYRTMPCLVTGKTVLQPHLARQESLRRNIGHVAAETYLITRLAITLLRYLGFDLYLPSDIGELKPVLIFVTGGAWIIG